MQTCDKVILSSRGTKVGAESMSHEVIWRSSLTEVAASRKAPRMRNFTGGCWQLAAIQVYKEGQRQEVRGGPVGGPIM